MSEAIKLRRFSHKALFYAPVITVNYKQQDLWMENAKGKVGLFISTLAFCHPVGTLISGGNNPRHVDKAWKDQTSPGADQTAHLS